VDEGSGPAAEHEGAGVADGPRKVFVGDVQGCADELDELLARLTDRYGDDFVVYSVGDLVNRGPGSLRVLERMRELGEDGRAQWVLGNHELHLVMVALELRPLGERDTFGDVLGTSERDEWVDWLRGRPIALTGRIGTSPFAMVHASVHPDWPLERLDEEARRVEHELGAADVDVAWRLLSERPPDAKPGSPRDVLGRIVSCRSVRGERWSSAVPGGGEVAWHEAWLARGHDYGVVYGHWSMQGLHVAPGLRGLDTGCVHHGRGRDGFLTAWLPEPTTAESHRASAFDVPDARFLQVPAKAHYYRW
jgi:bis(5'-nucleosyl)-tetraphosphatase (symmetrical)